MKGDLFLHSDGGVLLQLTQLAWSSFKDLRPCLLVSQVLINLFCELHASNSLQLFYRQRHHVLRGQKWRHTRLTTDLLITTWDRHRAHFVHCRRDRGLAGATSKRVQREVHWTSLPVWSSWQKLIIGWFHVLGPCARLCICMILSIWTSVYISNTCTCVRVP